MGIADDLFPKAAPPAPPPQGTPAPAVAAPPEAPKRGFGTRAYEWLVPRGEEGLRHVDFPDFKYMHEMPRADLPITSKEARETGMGLMFARDKEAKANVVRNSLGVDVQYDNKGNPYFHWKGQGYYVNPPGLDQGDVNQVLGQVAGYGAAGRAASAGRRSTGGKMIRTGAGEAGYSVGEDLVGDIFGAEQGVSKMKAALAGFSAALFEGIAPIAIRKWRGVFGDTRFIDKTTGRLNAAGKAAARRAGLDVTQMSARMQDAFAKNARDTAGGLRSAEDLQAAAGYAQGDEFGIPYTRGQATGDFDQLAMEESMRHSSFGDEAGGIIRDFDVAQGKAIDKAAGGVQDTIAGGKASAARPRDAGEALRETTVAKERADNAAVDDAYLDARTAAPSEQLPRMHQSSVLGTTDNVRASTPALRNMVNGRLNASGRQIDKDLTPYAVQSNKIITRFIQTAKKSLARRLSPFSIRHMETTRRKLNLRIENAQTPTDRGAATAIRDSYDDWWDQAIDAELMTGDPTKWAVLKHARKTSASYHKRYSKQGRRDPAGNVVERILIDNPTGEQVVNWVFGNSVLRADGNSVAVVRRLREIGGEDSMQQLRELAWIKLIQNKSGKALPPSTVKRNIDEAFGSASSLMDELFPEAEIQALMKEYGEAVGRTVTPAGATNPSKSGHAIGRMIQTGLRSMAGGARMRGDVPTSMGLRGVAAVTRPGRITAGRAGEAVSRPSLRPRPHPLVPGAAGAVGGGLFDDDGPFPH